jgi:hypothetical protein
VYVLVSFSLWERLAFAFLLSFFFSAFIHTHLYYVACSPGGQLGSFLGCRTTLYIAPPCFLLQFLVPFLSANFTAPTLFSLAN